MKAWAALFFLRADDCPRTADRFTCAGPTKHAVPLPVGELLACRIALDNSLDVIYPGVISGWVPNSLAFGYRRDRVNPITEVYGLLCRAVNERKTSWVEV
jgi:hypothetical protein